MNVNLNSINKEFLLKNRFWIVLGVSILMILTGMIYLEAFVNAETEREVIEKALAKTSTIKPPFQSKITTDAREGVAKKAQLAEAIVWRDSYQAQEKLFQWPKKMEDTYHFLNGRFATGIKIIAPLTEPKTWPADTDHVVHGEFIDLQETAFTIKNRKGEAITFQNTVAGNTVSVQGELKPVEFATMGKYAAKKLLAVSYQLGKYFNDPLTVSEQRDFAESYQSQIHEMLQIIEPLDVKGKGVVQLRNWLYQTNDWPDEKMSFVRYVRSEWDLNNDISKEAWIAQENLWIQKEIYGILRAANDTISVIKGEGGDKRNKPYTFKNAYFELTLALNDKNELSFKIKNLQTKRQKLDDLRFRVRMNKQGAEPEIITFSSNPLEPLGDKQGKDTFVQSVRAKEAPRQGIYSVDQVLTWETAAVKRIDYISIGSNASTEFSHSHRTFPDGLRPLEPPPVELKKDKSGKPIAAKTERGGSGSNQQMLPHGLWTERYVEVSDQSRRVPVCVVLIVDQANVDRVLTAFNNSRLRFLDTQVLLNQYSGSLQPPTLPSLVKDKKTPGTGVGIQPTFNPLGPRNKGPRKDPAAGQPPPSTDNNRANVETNMELVIYGIMTLYQRYPPRPVVMVPKK